MTFKDRKPCFTMTSEEAKAIYDFIDILAYDTAFSGIELNDLILDFKDFYEGDVTDYFDVKIEDDD